MLFRSLRVQTVQDQWTGRSIVDRRQLCKTMFSASAASVFSDGRVLTASDAVERAFRNSQLTRELLRRASYGSNFTTTDRASISEGIELDYALNGKKAPQIVWYEKLDDFVLSLLQAPSLDFDHDGLKGTTIVGDHFTWNGSLRFWYRFMQEPLSYDWRRYDFLYDIITSLLSTDCADAVHQEVESSFALVVSRIRPGTFSSEQIDRAKRSISSIHTMGISYAYAISLIDATTLVGFERHDSIIREMMTPINAYELGLRFLLATDDKLLCVERSQH